MRHLRLLSCGACLGTQYRSLYTHNNLSGPHVYASKRERTVLAVVLINACRSTALIMYYYYLYCPTHIFLKTNRPDDRKSRL